jgi:hypothetical protein
LKKHPKETNASLARRFNSCTTCKLSLTAPYLSRFRAKNGYDVGSTCEAFNAAYVWLEKMRIFEDNPKSKDRLKMEELWADRGGFDTLKTSAHKGVIMRKGRHCQGPISSVREPSPTRWPAD